MLLESALIQWLLSSSLSCGEKIFPAKMPQGTMQDSYPAIVIHRISTPQRLKTNNGYVGVVETVLQVDCLALSWQDAATLCDSARVSNGGGSISLENFAGDMNGVQVLGVFVDDQRDLSQNFAPQHGDEYGAYSHMLQLRIWYQDNTP